MNAREWEIVQRVFDQALNTEESEREKLIQEQLDGQPRLEQKVWELLEADAANSTFGATGAAARSLHTLDHLDADSTVGSYKIIRRIGEGGMGSVYLAERADETFTKQVALKRIRGDLGETAKERFKIERQALAQLEHPNIARLLDGGVDEQSRPYVVMEYVDGHPITAHCDIQNLTVDGRLRLFMGLCEAVQHAHQNLIVHRDIKPSNVLVNGENTVKLLDFGIAKLLGPMGEQHAATATAARVLTPDYASPEQVTGQPIAVTTDVYQLGAMLYELLCGLKPLDTRDMTPSQFEAALLKGDIRPPSQFADRLADDTEQCEEIANHRQVSVTKLHTQLEGDLDTIVRKAMAPEPTQRYQSATALAEDIQRYLTGLPIKARPASLGYRVGKFVRRNAIAVGVAAVFVATIAGFSIFLVQQAERLRIERDSARQEKERAEATTAFLVETFSQANPLQKSSAEVTADDILQAGERYAQEYYGNDLVLQSDMMRLFGEIYTGLGNDQSAKTYFEEALRAARKTQTYRDDAEAQLGLSDYWSIRRDWGASEEINLELFDHWPELTATQHVELLLLQSYVAKGRGDISKSISQRARALEIAEQETGPNSDLTIRSLCALLSQQLAIEDLSEVARLSKTLQSKDISQLAPATQLFASQRMAGVHQLMGASTEVMLEHQKAATALALRAFGKDSLRYHSQLFYYIRALRSADMPELALNHAKQRLDFYRVNVPDRLSTIGMAELTVAVLLDIDLDLPDEAESFYVTAEQNMRAFGDRSMGYANVLSHYARFLAERKMEFETALETFVKAKQILSDAGIENSSSRFIDGWISKLQTKGENDE